MASRFASALGSGGRWWARGSVHPAAACATAAAAAALGRATRPVGAEEEGTPVLIERSAGNLKPHHLGTWQQGGAGIVNERDLNKVTNPLYNQWPHMNFLNPDELVRGHIIINDSKSASRAPELKSGCVRANATKEIYWEPEEVRAAICTCGGLCPGLNSIIREVTNCLWFQYGVRTILGIQAGYNGLSNPEEHTPIELTPPWVREIHMKGGSVLKAARGGFDPPLICEKLEKMGVNMLFLVGGDGTQSAGNLLYEEARKRGMKLSIVGVPKSIDNDVMYFDKTFGFDSAVAAASEVIRNGWVEATSCEKGVGIVKLMGRDAGFVAMNAALASTIVDLCLVPEVKVKLDDVMSHIDKTLARKDFMVIAVAEGAGQEFVSTGKKDATGHTIYGDIGSFLKSAVNKHLKESGGRSFYIDPSYIIRSVPIKPNDHIYCSRLARDAVHTAMRGYTGVCVGALHNVIVIMPSKLIAGKKRHINIKSANWQSCVQTCNMPGSLSGLADITEK